MRDNLVTALGRVLMLCLDDDARVPFERIHDVVRTRQVAAYDLLHVLPLLRYKVPWQQLYKMLQMLERAGGRYVSEYASLCINVFSRVGMEEARLTDMLLGVNNEVIESISRDKNRAGAIPPSSTEAMDFLLRAARHDGRFLNLRMVSAILLNYPIFDLTDPEVPDAVRFVARRMRERSRPDDPLLRYAETSLENPEDLLKTVLERLEVDELSSDATKEAVSLLLQNLGARSYPSAPSWKHNPRRLLTIANDRYPVHAVAVAKYLADRLNDSRLRDLDIGFYETGDHALLQVLSRLRDQPDLRHLRKPLSLLTPFVSQKLASDANHDYAAPVSFYEVNRYLDSFDTPCLRQDVGDAMRTLRPHLANDLPWSYAFGDRRASDDPWELILTSLVRLRSVPVSRQRASAIDNFIYKSRANSLTGEQGSLYDSGVIFQRDDTINVEVDLYSLLMRIPNVFKSEKFAPMLNFLSKPDILNFLGYKFNKFEHESPRSLLLALLERALELSSVKSDHLLSKALRNAHSHLVQPLVINQYTSENLQQLLKHLPGIENDPRYLPLKIFFKKQKLFAYLSPTFRLIESHTPMEKLSLILRTVGLKVTQPKLLSESLSFALNSIDGPPLPVRPFDRDDFVYLTKRLLSYNKTLQDEILRSPVYANVGDWNISMSGTPENVLARAMSHPVDSIAKDAHLTYIVRRAESFMGDKILDIKILKERTLESMGQYLPKSAYVKPVNLLLRKANLMTLVPTLDLAILENATARDALIALLRNLTESHAVRAEKLLLRRVRAALSFLDGANENDRQTPMVAYLVQSLQNPNNIIYQPLLQKLKELRNLTISPDERQAWLQRYLHQIVAENKTQETLREAALMALRNVAYNESMDEKSRDGKERIKTALSFLPIDSSAAPLRKLLTPDWVYDILPEEHRSSDLSEKEELLLAILYYAKRRTDVAGNPALMRAISKVEMSLNGWRTNVKPLREAVAVMKAAVYDPVKDLLTATGLNKIGITVPPAKPAKVSLLELLRRLLSHPAIEENGKVSELLSTVRQDVLAFGIDVDLLTVLDDVGIAYTSKLAPIRLFLHRRDINEKFGRTVFAIAQPKQRYRALLEILQKQHQLNNDTRFHDALSALRNIRLVEREPAGTLVSDLFDIVNAIPHHVRQHFKSIEHLFNANTLSHLTRDNKIIESKTPLTILLNKMAELPEIRDNYTIANVLNAMRSEIELSDDRPIITSFQLRPLLLELRHVQQINVDFLNYILDPEVLSYLNSEEFSDMPDDSAEILRTVVDYMLNKGPAYVDNNVQRHLQSFKRTLMLTMGPGIARHQLTNEDWKKMTLLIPHTRDFTPIRIFLQSREIFKYVPADTNWRSFSTPGKKLLHLLTLMENSDISNQNVRESASKLRENLKERFDFVTEEDVKNMHRAIASLKLKYDLVPLKVFLNHDNMIKYLPPDFRCAKYNTSIDALAALLDNLLQMPSLRRRTVLYKAMAHVKQSLLQQSRRVYRKANARGRVSSEELEFVISLNMTLPSLREFLNPRKLAALLPETFSLDNRPTFKMKTLHLLRGLLELDTEMDSELAGLLREVENYPDVPAITRDDLAPILKIIPDTGIPHVELVTKYLKPSTMIRLFPGNFDIKKSTNARVALYDTLILLNVTLGLAKDDKLQTAIDVLISELTKIKSNLMPQEMVVDNNDIKSIINEIPFKRYGQLEQLEAQMTTARVVSSLSLNFKLIEYKTKKLRLLAVLDELSKSDAFRSWSDSIDFVRRLVGKMPDMPKVNDTEIEKLLSPLPLNAFYQQHLVSNCRLAALAPYLPIHFDLNGVETRKSKIAEILQYCKLANPKDVSTRQALTNAEAFLKKLPDFDVTRDHVEVLIGAIPCTHFTTLKPLLRFLSQTDIASLLPWDLDLYKASTFKLRIFDLLTALRNVKELQNDKMFAALDTLETNAKSLPDKVTITDDVAINTLKSAVGIDSQPCEAYRNFVLTSENLIRILPPTYQMELSQNSVFHVWSFILRSSSLFLREVKMNGRIKEGYEYAMNVILTAGKDYLQSTMWERLQHEPFKQLVPLRLYTLGHPANTFSRPIDDVYRGFFHGPTARFVSVAMRQFIRGGPEMLGSKSLINDMEVFLHNYVVLGEREKPSQYEIDMAIREIPSNDERYGDLRLLMRCPNIQAPIMERNVPADGTSKQLLLDMLQLAETGDIDEKIRNSIKSIRPGLERGAREEEAEYVLKQMRDYRYHADKVEAVRSYLEREGLRQILGDVYLAKYPTYRERLVAISKTLTDSANLTNELRAASDHLRRVLNNEIRIEHAVPRTMDDINVQSLFFALPRTRDEGVIRGIIRFFSVPELLRQLNLPRDPFEYGTKGRLLRAIMDVGQELGSVRKDPAQQEALEYFRDKITLTGAGAQPIELKRYARSSNVNVDMYGAMRAIDYGRADETVAAKVAVFFESTYDNLVHAVGFDHTAYATRGAYLRALFGHLVGVARVPDDVKRQIASLIPAIRLDGPGDEAVDLNDDVAPDMRMLGDALDAPYYSTGNYTASRSFGRNGDSERLPYAFQENKESLRTAVHDVLESITSSEEDHLDYVRGAPGDYRDKTRVMIGVPHTHEIGHPARRQSTAIGHSARTSPVRIAMDDFASPVEKARGQKSPRSKMTMRKRWGKNRSTGDRWTSIDEDDVLEIPLEKVHVDGHKVTDGRAKRLESASSWKTKLSSEELAKAAASRHRTHRRESTKGRRLLIRPDASVDIEYYDEIEYGDENAAVPNVRMLRDALRRSYEGSLSHADVEELTKAEQAGGTGERTRTVKKDLSSSRSARGEKETRISEIRL